METTVRIEAESFSDIDPLYQIETIENTDVTLLSLVHRRNSNFDPDLTAGASTQSPLEDGKYNITLAYFDEGDGKGEYQVNVSGTEVAAFTTLDSFFLETVPSFTNNYMVSTVAEGIDIYSDDILEVIFTTNLGESRSFDFIEFTRVGDAPIRDVADPITPIDFGEERRPRIDGTGRNDVLRGTFQAEIFRGKGGNDLIIARSGNDRIVGGKGRDEVKGGSGRDFIAGEDGNDLLIGGGKSDIIVGGKGRDTLRGGNGQDSFVFKSLNEGRDTILDFDVNKDVLDVRQILSGVEYQAETGYEKFVDFVRVEQIGARARVMIDSDGVVGDGKFTTIAILRGVEAETVVSTSFVI